MFPRPLAGVAEWRPGEFNSRLPKMSYKDNVKQRKYQLNWMHKRREVFFTGKVCLRCGEADTKKLVLHHTDPTVKEDHRIWSWSDERRTKELEKCIVLCRSCHGKIHTRHLRKHGTRSRYQAGCRCEACRAKMRECQLRWKERANA